MLSPVLGVEVTKKIILIPPGGSLSPRSVSEAQGMELRHGTMTSGKESGIFDAQKPQYGWTYTGFGGQLTLDSNLDCTTPS